MMNGAGCSGSANRDGWQERLQVRLARAWKAWRSRSPARVQPRVHCLTPFLQALESGEMTKEQFQSMLARQGWNAKRDPNE